LGDAAGHAGFQRPAADSFHERLHFLMNSGRKGGAVDEKAIAGMAQEASRIIAGIDPAHGFVIGDDSEYGIGQVGDLRRPVRRLAPQLLRQFGGLAMVDVVHRRNTILLVFQATRHVGAHPADSHKADVKLGLRHQIRLPFGWEILERWPV
jgi:hypothetical protein